MLYDPDNAHEESGQPCKRLRTEVQAADEDCGDKHSDLADCVRPPAKKPAEAQCVEVCRSYVSSWEAYIQGNVVSESSRRFISNLLMATAACRSEQQGDSSDDSDAEPWSNLNTTTGNMQVVENILNGLAKHSAEDGEKGLGRHGSTIRLGRSLWQTPALTTRETEVIKECHFPEGTFPDRQKCRKALEAVRKQDEERPMPFAGATQANAMSTTVDYGARLAKWFQKLDSEPEGPNVKQRRVLQSVCDRILVECRVVKEDRSLSARSTTQEVRDRVP